MELYFNDLVGRFGLPAIFFLTMVEGDITLLLAGVLAHGQAFGDYSFGQVLLTGTLGGVVSDNAAYALGRGGRSAVREYRFYNSALPRLKRLMDTFGPLSMFISKYTYGLRWAACIFYGVAHASYPRFLALSFASCFVWVLTLAGVGYFFHSAIYNLIGDFKNLGKWLLVIVGVGVVAFYLVERYWLTKKVEEADPETVQKFEQAAEEKIHEIREEIQEHLPPLARRKEKPPRGRGGTEGD
ncbi:MAG TPA: DedA family protein [Pyrinomonadaceae bacterium]|nr:DedA family protein [Pyrinomonadaceae bacterium]